MSWNVILYTLGGLLVMLFGLPRVLWLVARRINAYTHPTAAAPKSGGTKRQGSKLRVPEMS